MHIFVLTGAGISAESGLGTFRDAGTGLWARFDPMKLATPEAFQQRPAEVQAFYNWRRQNLLAALPNPAHLALARFGDALHRRGGRLTLVTQNIDDLHERAGSNDVLHMHGELLKARCLACHAIADCREDLSQHSRCAACGGVGALRPHVVWFGETPLFLDLVAEWLPIADLFVAIGTSGAVYPAAGFVAAARRHGVPTCEINLEPADNASLFDQALYGPASDCVPAWCEKILATLDASHPDQRNLS